MIFGFHAPVLGGGAIGGLWLMFIGWFLNNAALVSYRRLLVKESLEAVPVARLMQTRFTRVDPAISVSRLVEEHLMASGQRVMPVEQSGRFLGMVCLQDLQRTERSAWDRLTAADIMTPASRLASVPPAWMRRRRSRCSHSTMSTSSRCSRAESSSDCCGGKMS